MVTGQPVSLQYKVRYLGLAIHGLVVERESSRLDEDTSHFCTPEVPRIWVVHLNSVQDASFGRRSGWKGGKGKPSKRGGR